LGAERERETERKVMIQTEETMMRGVISFPLEQRRE